MRSIEVQQLKYDLTPVAGLALVVNHLKTLAPMLARVDAALPVRCGASNSDILRSYLGLPVPGKSDFEAIENHRGEEFYKQALGILLLPSSPTLRQRMDAQAHALSPHVLPMIETLLTRRSPDFGVLPCGWLPVDIDTFAMVQRRHGQGRGGPHLRRRGRVLPGAVAAPGPAALCQGHAGQPAARDPAGATPERGRAEGAAAGTAGLGVRLRRADGQHRGAERAGRATGGLAHQVENPRSTDRAELAAQIDAGLPDGQHGAVRWEHPRHGKRVALWEQPTRIEGAGRPVRRVLRLIERTISAAGQHLIVPEYELDGWTTTLPTRLVPQQIIDLYADHGTHEQFHAEFKTDLDLTRLPSGKFATNALVCELAALAMNILRLMGQQGLLGPDAPVRHSAKRRRIKTVMQELIYRAGRLIEHGRQLILGLGANDRAGIVFKRLHAQLAAAP